MTDYATRLINDVDTAQRVRLLDTHRATPGGPLTVRGGVRPDGGGVVSVVPSSMNVKLTRFSADVPGTSLIQGGYGFVHDDPDTTYPVLPGDPIGDRVDLVVARVRDDSYDGSTFTDAGVVVIKGDPSTGLPPSVPAGTTPLWELNVTSTASAGTGGLTVGVDRRLYSVGAGGIVPVASSGERDAMGALAGAAVFNKESGTWEGFDGSGWVPLHGNFQTGSVAVPAVGVFTSTLKVRRAGNLVVLSGAISRASGGSSSLTTCAQIPTGFRPPGTRSFSALTFASATNYEFIVSSSGAVQIRVSAASSVGMDINIPYITDNAFPA